MSKKQSCRCCKEGKLGNINGGKIGGYVYNRLQDEAQEWAVRNGMTRSEFCVPVQNGKRFSGPAWIKKKCGDGRFGFTMRRAGQNEVKMELGLDGQFKKKRNTLIRRKSARATTSRRPRRVDGSKFSLVSSTTIAMASRDPSVIAQRKREYKKLMRAKNRNNAARRGHKRAT